MKAIRNVFITAKLTYLCGVGIFIILAMLLLAAADKNQDKRDEEQYDIIQGDLRDFVKYVSEKDDFYIVSGGAHVFPTKAIPVDGLDISRMCYPGADVELYYKKGTDMQEYTEVKLSDGTNAYYDGSVVAIKFDVNMFAWRIIGWCVLFLLANSVACLIIAVAVKVHKKKPENEKNSQEIN